MFKKIIYIVEDLFNTRDYDRFGLPTFKNRGYEVEVWDLTNLINPHVCATVKVPDPIEGNFIKFFTSDEQVMQCLDDVDHDTMIISRLSYQSRNVNFFKKISDRKIFYTTNIAIGPLPFWSMEYLSMDFKQPEYNILGIRGVDLVLAGGIKSLKKNYPVGNHTKVIWAHTPDYDLFLDIQKKAIEQRTDTIVFLDEYLPYHSDFIQLGVEAPDNAEQYYKTLNKFFDMIEEQLGMPVVIAAHPSAHYDETPGIYNGRKIIQFSTPTLVSQAKLIILHASTAVNFAVLFQKPCLFVTTNRIENSFSNFRNVQQYMSMKLGKYIINADSINHAGFKSTLNKELSINEALYKDYIESYIKYPGSPEKNSWEIFCDYLEKI